MANADLPDDRAPEETVERSSPPLETTPEERQWGMFCHLSALLGMVVGGLSIVGPLICWLLKKDTSKFGKVNSITWRGPDGKMQIRLDPIAPMPDDLKEAIKAEAGGTLPEELK